MNIKMDISPDKIKWKRVQCTQTEIDLELISKAKRIVDNYEKIEGHWRKREQMGRSILLKGGLLILWQLGTKIVKVN